MAHAIYEWVYIGAVVAILCWVGAASWNVERTIEEVPADAETIKVIGQQWFWSFEHADGTKEVNELHVEKGKPYRFEITSLDVNHAFNVPDYTLLIDAVPGRINTLWNAFDQTGEFLIQCREYCGFSHYNMKAKLFVEPPQVTPAAAETGAGGETTTASTSLTPATPAKTTSPSTGQTAVVGTSQQPSAATTTTSGTSGNATTESQERMLYMTSKNTTSGTSGNATTASGGSSTQQGAAAGATLTILEGSSIQGNPSYDPKELEVKKGDTINVKNADTMMHTVTNGKSSTDPNSAKLFDTKFINGGESAEIDTSNIDAGTYPFYCMVHPYMTGSLTIE